MMGNGCLTPYGVRGYGMSSEDCYVPTGYLCLTPYGVRGYGIYCVGGGHGGGQNVLNALRRQRLWHGGFFVARYTPRQCLTPYGVRGYGIGKACQC